MRLYLASGQPERALADLNETQRVHVLGDWDYAARAALYLEMGELETAAADYDRIGELGPKGWHHYKRRAKRTSS